MIFYKGAEATSWRKDNLFNKWTGAIKHSQGKTKNKNLDLNLTPYLKVNSEWITELKCKTVKIILGKKIG